MARNTGPGPDNSDRALDQRAFGEEPANRQHWDPAEVAKHDDEGRELVTLQGQEGTQIRNVAAGTMPMDAVNVQQMQNADAATLQSAKSYADAGDAAMLTASKSYTDGKSTQTLQSANAYTDGKFAAWNDSFTQYQQQVDLRFAQTDKRIDQMGAMSGAMTSAAINTAGLPGRNRVGMGVGVQNGRSAVAVSYQRLVRPNASVSLTGAFSSGESSISAGAGFSW